MNATDGSKYVKIILLAIFCHAMCLFGYVYEQVVDVPNMWGSDPAAAKKMWTDYHTISNPEYYYILVTTIGLIAVIYLWVKRNKIIPADKKHARNALVLVILTNICTGIAVSNINNRLYFGTVAMTPGAITKLAALWSIVNSMRILFVAGAIYQLFSILHIGIRPSGEK